MEEIGKVRRGKTKLNKVAGTREEGGLEVAENTN